MPREVYPDAVLSLYELNEVGPLIDIFMWSYERSCRKYETVMDNVGEVDPFRVQYRNERKRAVTAVILAGLKITECESFIEDWSKTEVAEEDRERFTAHVLVELGRMHEGSLAGHGVTLSQFQSWKEKQG